MKWIGCFALLCIYSASASAETTVWKTETFADDCTEAAGPKLDANGNLLDGEGDFVLHKCKTKYGPVMWLLYQDSSRMSIGFGDTPSTAYTGLLDRGDWPLEWGGVEANGKFVAKSATMRFSMPGEEANISTLIVYKIAEGKPACVVAIVDPGPGENERARQISGGVNANTKCDLEPDVLDWVK
jgi:hypothetical protein